MRPSAMSASTLVMLTALQMEPGRRGVFREPLSKQVCLGKEPGIVHLGQWQILQNAGLAAAGTFVATIFRYAFAHLQHRRFAAMCTYKAARFANAMPAIPNTQLRGDAAAR